MEHDYISSDVDKREVTKLIALLAKALESDYQNQSKVGIRKGRFSLREFNRLILQAYGLNNKQALTYGKSIGNKILKGIGLNSTDSLIKPIDLQAICLFVLKNQGALGWPKFIQTIESAGPEFKGLLSISATDPTTIIGEVREGGVEYLLDKRKPLTKQLRDLADSIEPLEAKIEQMKAHSMNLAEANANLANRNQALEEAIKGFKDAIERLKDGAKKESNDGKRRQMEQVIENLEQKVFNFIN